MKKQNIFLFGSSVRFGTGEVRCVATMVRCDYGPLREGTKAARAARTRPMLGATPFLKSLLQSKGIEILIFEILDNVGTENDFLVLKMHF